MVDESIIKEIRRKAHMYDQYSGCSQSVLLALQEGLDTGNEESFRSGTVLAGGVAKAAAVEKPTESSFELSDIKGVGKATEEKLRKAGYDSVDSIVSVDTETLAEKAGISQKVATKLIESAKALKA